MELSLIKISQNFEILNRRKGFYLKSAIADFAAAARRRA
jgi:hypothetical protein